VIRSPRIVVVGAGISGLATAFALQEALPAAVISVLENQGRVGGTIWTEHRDGFQVEYGPTAFLGNQASTLCLAHKVGLKDEIIEPSPAAQLRFLWHDGQMHALPTSLGGLFGSKLISFAGLYRLATERFRRQRAASQKPDESIYQFAERRVGRALADLFSDALTTGIFAGDYKLLSLRSCFPRIARAEREFGSVLGGLPRIRKIERDRAREEGGPEPYAQPVSLSFSQGMRRLVEAVQSRLTTPPRLNTGVKALKPASNKTWNVITEAGEQFSADAVILACPAMRQAGLLADLDGDLAEALLSIPYSSVVVVALGYLREHVPGIAAESYGFIVPQKHRRDVLGVQFCSAVFEDRAPPGHVLLRAICGGWHRREMAVWEEDALAAVVRRELRNLLGVTKPPQFLSVVRCPKAIPQYTLGHASRVATIERLAGTYPGLFLSGNSFHGVSINECTAQAERMARIIQDYFGGR
jgi:oxygen-dependent protoporphyrinogen oxidase